MCDRRRAGSRADSVRWAGQARRRQVRRESPCHVQLSRVRLVHVWFDDIVRVRGGLDIGGDISGGGNQSGCRTDEG